MDASKGLIEKAKECQTAEELVALAKENGYELSIEDAELYLQDFAEGELADEELDNVAGGQEGCRHSKAYIDVYWPTPGEVQYLFNVGDTVQAYCQGCEKHTVTATVRDRRTKEFFKWHRGGSIKGESIGFADEYYISRNPGTRGVFHDDWRQRHLIEEKSW